MSSDAENRHIDPRDTIRRRLADRKRPNWKIALICFRPYQDSQAIITKLKAEPMDYRLFSLEDFPGAPRVYQATVNDVGIVILRGQILGGPHTSVIMEELAALGVETIVGQGIAGSMEKSIVIGDQVLGVKALDTDGTSRVYIRGRREAFPDEVLAGVVRESAADLDIEIKEAAVATVDAFYQETAQMIGRWRKRGADILNMEVTPLYAVAHYYDLKAIWLGYISDSIFSRPTFQYGNEVRERCDLICLHTLNRLSMRRPNNLV